MILVDLNQVMISSVMAQLKRFDGKPDENLIRHMILSSIKYYNRNFKSKYGNMVICCDNKAYWRKSIFPQYKAGRRQERDGDTIDWSVIYETLNKIKSEIKENLGYHVIEVDNAEADDIIGTLCKYVRDEPILILSSDKDFMQLQKYDNVEQFSPNAKKFVQADNPIKYIREQVIRGDRGDGIPNVFSPDDTFRKRGVKNP